MTDSKEMISMRNAQWARAKGEMEAFLHFFWPEYNPYNGKPEEGFFSIANKAIKDCIKTIDDNM